MARFSIEAYKRRMERNRPPAKEWTGNPNTKLAQPKERQGSPDVPPNFRRRYNKRAQQPSSRMTRPE